MPKPNTLVPDQIQQLQAALVENNKLLEIEAALERVREVAMNMHKAGDLLNICEAMYQELVNLGMSELRNTMINIHNDADETFLNYDYSSYAGRAVTRYGYHIHPIIENLVMRSRSARDAFVEVAFTGAELQEWKAFRHKSGETDDERLSQVKDLHYYFYSIGIGSIGISTFDAIQPEKLALLKRFKNVFQLAYQRFTDLTLAEAQAREATIETALERVRGKALAMHTSQEVAKAANSVFIELKHLGIESFRSGVGLLNKKNKKAIVYASSSVLGDSAMDLMGEIEMKGHKSFEDQYQAFLQQETYTTVLEGEDLVAYRKQVLQNFQLEEDAQRTTHPKEYGYYFPFSEGLMYAWHTEPYNEEEIKILNRFKTVFDLTFRRYLELKRAERNALEALRSAALDRVRAEIASMRTQNDLERITPLIWKELHVLNVPFVRCGVFIMDEAAAKIHSFLSTPEGKAIAAFHLSYAATALNKAVAAWRKKKTYQAHWDMQDYAAFADAAAAEGQAIDKKSYLAAVPSSGIDLYFLPFLQGMLYVGNTGQLNNEELGLVQAVADAFSTAYSRYEDFNKLEDAKKQIEKTLIDLQAAQKQLVQSEKMASLGQLTAGIAHEIQNPLNFVNNFSELSSDLLEEMKAELVAGKTSEAFLTLQDVQENLEKINHHGKRAGEIVKGMLQHSRTSTGIKEPTDINTLVDEYFRLAYHGLRAKDKSFNASMKTEYGANLPPIAVVAQDIGRIVLNLITNAFYAVDDKSKKRTAAGIVGGYDPTVWITTRSTTQEQQSFIEIAVTDNGAGVPDAIKEKIFQPFFTTKPTGQGTGLGLSLSYDIAQAHGGEMTVDSKENEGSVFIVKLPL
jgi:signal transduction histidine kinase